MYSTENIMTQTYAPSTQSEDKLTQQSEAEIRTHSTTKKTGLMSSCRPTSGIDSTIKLALDTKMVAIICTAK